MARGGSISVLEQHYEQILFLIFTMDNTKAFHIYESTALDRVEVNV